MSNIHRLSGSSATPSSAESSEPPLISSHAEMLGRLFLHFPVDKDLSEVEWAVLTEDYLRVMMAYPLDALDRGITAGLRRWKFRPRIAELIEACEPFRPNRPAPAPEPLPEPAPTLSEAEADRIQARAEGVQDTSLRAAVQRLIGAARQRQGDRR
jgi:hypothetical protein